ncbi:MAG: protein kinase [Myxococcales bacterium]|nr:protein kinase [Myxococcales bacterium]
MSLLEDDALAATQTSAGSSGSAPGPVDPRPPTLDGLNASDRLVRRHRLGKGAMGEVVACEDRNLGRTLALKAALKKDPAALERFLREARIQGQLEHPNVVPVHELGAGEDGTPYFTMKRVRGVTLAEVLRLLAARDATTATEWPLRKLLGAFQEVCRAVHFAHSRGVVHRDLKPANVMLGDHGEVYVLDWGVARTTGEAQPDSGPDFAPLDVTPGHTSAGAVIGTPGYMAPEQTQGRVATPKSDVWALGAVLFEVLTLEPLVKERAAVAAMLETQQGVTADAHARAPEKDVPPELSQVCLRATSSSPEERPTAQELHDAVEAVLAGQRDGELRARIARGHADAAASAAARVFAGGADALEARREAMQQLGRCLALEPDNAAAQATFVKLLATPPSQVPQAVQGDLDDTHDRAMRRAAKNSAWGFSLMLLAGPALLLMGIARPLLLAAMAAAVLVAVVVSWLESRNLNPTRLSRRLAIVASLATVGLSGVIFGPFILVPALLPAVLFSLLMWARAEDRPLTLAAGAATILIPVAGWALGLFAAPYRFTSEGMLVVPYLTKAFPPGLTLVLLGGVILGNFVVSATNAIRLRNSLDDSQRALALQGWNLKQMLRTPTPAKVEDAAPGCPLTDALLPSQPRGQEP